jgi:phage regulator Rha-like protein
VTKHLPTVETVADRITLVRGQRVMLDVELARLFGVQTERLNQQVQRNLQRFPEDFMFRLTQEEWEGTYLQIAGTLQRSRRTDRLPLAFTEHGCLMLSNVLRSPRAVEVSVLVVRAFVRMRGVLAANTELAARVDELGRELEKQGGKLDTHDLAIRELLAKIRLLTEFPEPTRRKIGFTEKW